MLFQAFTTSVGGSASVTRLRAPEGKGGTFAFTKSQLLTNQRISQAAVRRSNELIDRIRHGITPDDIRDGTITAIDLSSDAGG